MSPLCAQKLARLQAIIAERATWTDQRAQIKRLHTWRLVVEHLLDGSRIPAGKVVSNATMGCRLDRWREQMARDMHDGSLSELERECLTEFVQALANLRPYLVPCDDRQDVPRTNTDMERSIRRRNTRSRRISGRTNWNASLVRYGRAVASFEWWEQDAARHQQWMERVSTLDHASVRASRQEIPRVQHEQRTRFRFRHTRQAVLASLEARWAAAPTPLLP